MIPRMPVIALLIAAALLAASASPAAAQSAAEFYRGRTMNLIVGSGEGGGYDLSARLAVPFRARHIPGRLAPRTGESLPRT